MTHATTELGSVEAPMHVLLSGIVGSTAYGLNRPGSDVDRLGVFAWDTVQLFNLNQVGESLVTTSPDVTLHEARKAARLMLKSNPTVLELLYLDQWETATALGEELIAIRDAFPTASLVRDAYCG